MLYIDLRDMDDFDGLGAVQSLGSGVGTTASWRTLAIVGDQAARKREARKKLESKQDPYQEAVIGAINSTVTASCAFTLSNSLPSRAFKYARRKHRTNHTAPH